jgi:hypothetical protein
MATIVELEEDREETEDMGDREEMEDMGDMVDTDCCFVRNSSHRDVNYRGRPYPSRWSPQLAAVQITRSTLSTLVIRRETILSPENCARKIPSIDRIVWVSS